VSTGLQREIRESLSITGRTEVIPNGVDTDIFLPGPRDEASAQLGLVPSRFRFIFAGVYKPAKGIDVLLDAMRIVHEKYPDSELILIGKSNNSPYYRQYAEQAGSLGITQAVRFVPLMPKSVLAAWFRASDAFVLSSRTEGFGIVLCEAMSCGLPVIATRSGGPEDIVDNTNGLLVDPGDCDLLANAMMRMYENIRLYRSRKEEIREFVKSRYGFESVAARIVEVYRSVL
jgi:glycosyltransferase involved in cell wall biosynthesis